MMKKIFKWTLFAVATFEFSGLWNSVLKRQIAASKDRKKQRKALHLTVQVEVSLKGGQYIKPPVLNDSEDGPI